MTGDPCYLRFSEAVDEGALPFGCQGPNNALCIEGGETLAWEMVSALQEERRFLDRVFVQVGGGALATAVLRGFGEARDMGAFPRYPRVHTVQAAAASPLSRAWDRLVERILERPDSGCGDDIPQSRRGRAELIAERTPLSIKKQELDRAARHRSEYMWPLEKEPHSVAEAILDDETYDWLAVLEWMLLSHGYPLVVSEESLVEANQLAREETGIRVSHSGSAGLAGCLTLARLGLLGPEEEMAVLFTGVAR